MKYYHCLLSIVLLIVSCAKDNNESDQAIPIDLYRDKDVSTEINIREIIPLETNDNSIYSEISKLLVVDSSIFLLDNNLGNNTLFYFNTDGTFITKSNQGKGPGELLYPIELMYDTEDRTLHVWDLLLNKWTIYDIHLNHLSNKLMKSKVPIYNMVQLENSDWFIHKPTAPAAGDKDFYFYATTGPSSYNDQNKYIFNTPADYYSLDVAPPISKWYHENVKFVKPVGSTIYGLQDSTVYKAYQFDFVSLNINEDEYKYVPMIELLKMGRDGEKVVGIRNIIEKENVLGFSIVWRSESVYILYDKLNRTYITSLELSNSGVLPPGRLLAMDTNENFVLVVKPDKYNQWILARNNGAFNQTIKETNNDVLIVFNVSR